MSVRSKSKDAVWVYLVMLTVAVALLIGIFLLYAVIIIAALGILWLIVRGTVKLCRTTRRRKH